MTTRVPLDDLTYDNGCYFHAGKLFTGTAFDLWDTGAVLSERDFDQGTPDGWERAWSIDGVLLEEKPLLSGLVDGLYRRWHDNGVLASEARYEAGVRLSETTWDEAGACTSTYAIDPASPNYQRLLKARRR